MFLSFMDNEVECCAVRSRRLEVLIEAHPEYSPHGVNYGGVRESCRICVGFLSLQQIPEIMDLDKRELG